MGRAMRGHRFSVIVSVPGSWLLAGQSAAAPTIPLPEPGSEPGLFPALVILVLLTMVAAIELVRPLRTRSGATSRRWAGNLSLCILSNGVVVLPTITAFAAAFLSQLEQRGLLNSLGLPRTVRIVIAIIGLDVLAYAQHRLLHRIDILWRFHAVHHSDPEVDVTTTFRHHPIEAIFNAALVGGVVLAIGFSPAEIAIYTWVSFVIETRRTRKFCATATVRRPPRQAYRHARVPSFAPLACECRDKRKFRPSLFDLG